MVKDNRIRQIIREELTKTEVSSMIDSKFSSKDFEKLVKGITAEVMSDLFKVMWQRNSLWKSSVK